MKTTTPQEFCQCLSELPQTFILTSHKNPDGDGLGAMFSMGEGLKAFGKTIHYVLDAPVTDYYRFLEEHSELVHEMPATPGKTVLMSFDCGSKERIGLPEGTRIEDYFYINLDHHLSNSGFGDINLVRVDALSSCEIVYDLLRGLEITISPSMATGLYLGTVYDTGRFAYCHSPRAFEVAADLLKLGADHWAVFNALFRHNDFDDFSAMGEFYASLEQTHDGKLVTLDVQKDKTHKLSLEETENLINEISNIKGLEIAIIFKYIEENSTKISFRSRGKYSVCDIALAVGGGGHRNASGAIMHHDFLTSKRLVLDKVNEVMGETPQ
jgi:bifunctional oligoribonuclease and PAP phosphatase NrnA